MKIAPPDGAAGIGFVEVLNDAVVGQSEVPNMKSLQYAAFILHVNEGKLKGNIWKGKKETIFVFDWSNLPLIEASGVFLCLQMHKFT